MTPAQRFEYPLGEVHHSNAVHEARMLRAVVGQGTDSQLTDPAKPLKFGSVDKVQEESILPAYPDQAMDGVAEYFSSGTEFGRKKVNVRFCHFFILRWIAANCACDGFRNHTLWCYQLSSWNA